ncbi:MAG TPA: 50S ribosomal protein L23 [Luteibaculaceae bacterium]|nr:50S ribosomal protein L23 [Luteibaculaceae bacterium]
MSNIIIKPLLTEKTSALTDKLNRFAFLVNKQSNKVEIKKAIEKLYGVNVSSVNTINHPGKVKTRSTKTSISVGRTNAVKKAIVTLAEGETIDLYANI